MSPIFDHFLCLFFSFFLQILAHFCLIFFCFFVVFFCVFSCFFGFLASFFRYCLTFFALLFEAFYVFFWRRFAVREGGKWQGRPTKGIRWRACGPGDAWILWPRMFCRTLPGSAQSQEPVLDKTFQTKTCVYFFFSFDIILVFFTIQQKNDIQSERYKKHHKQKTQKNSKKRSNTQLHFFCSKAAFFFEGRDPRGSFQNGTSNARENNRKKSRQQRARKL